MKDIPIDEDNEYWETKCKDCVEHGYHKDCERFSDCIGDADTETTGIFTIDEDGNYHKKDGAQFLATGVAAEDGPPPDTNPEE